jgi:lipopolysaccharide export system protein LptA
MKNYLYKIANGCSRHRTGKVVYATVSLFLIALGTAMAAEIVPPANTKEPILIKADQLVIDSAANSAVFSGNARAVQGETVVTADKLTIISAKNKPGTPADKPSGGPGPKTASTDKGKPAAEDPGTDLGNIERIEAEGHVKIEFDNRVATTDKAVYHTAEKKLVLTGPGTKVVSGKDQVVGRMITFYREVGRVECVGDDNTQVKATVYSTERGLN